MDVNRADARQAAPSSALSMANMVPRPSALAAEFVPTYANSAATRSEEHPQIRQELQRNEAQALSQHQQLHTGPQQVPPPGFQVGQQHTSRGAHRGSHSARGGRFSAIHAAAQQQGQHLPYYQHGQSANQYSSATAGAYDMYANPHLRENARADMITLLRSAATTSVHGVPETINQYYNIMPLEATPSPVLPNFLSRCMVYKGVSADSGDMFALRRVLGPPPAHSVQIIRAADVWKRQCHPGIVTLREVFTTRAFTAAPASPLPIANELVISYDFCPRAETVQNLFLGPAHQHHALSEATMWSITTQLLAATAAVHAAGLTMRSALSLSSILVTGRNRVRINRVGLSDIFDPDGIDHLPGQGISPPPGPGSGGAPGGATLANGARVVALQKEDLANLGRILLMLSTRSQSLQPRAHVAGTSTRTALDTLQRSGVYTADFVQVVAVLLGASAPGSRTVVRDVLSMIGPRLAVEMANVWTHADSVQGQLVKECDASRLFRLAAMLGFVNERCDEATGDMQWSETGDRYLLKLFRDYVFHQVDEMGRPNMDFAHVLECLNRLDIGSPDQILLSSRDGISLIAASYQDLRRCLLQAVEELRHRGTHSASAT